MHAMDSEPCAGFDSFEVSGIGPTTSERQELERQHLVMWGEDRQREVEKLTAEKAELEQRCTESQAEVERLTVRCGELENEYANCVSENGDLRKQLAAYAVEITVLREDRENGQQALRDAQEAVQRLSVERTDLVTRSAHLVRSVQDLELDHTQRGDQLDSVLSSRRGDVALDAAGTPFSPRAFEFDTAGERRSSEDKDQRIDALLGVIQPLRDQLKMLQESFVKQTKEFGQFVQRVRQKQSQAVKDINALNINLAANWQYTQDMPQMVEELAQAHTGVEHGQMQHAGAMREAHQKLQDQVVEERRKARSAEEQSQRATEQSKALEAKEVRRRGTRLDRQDVMHRGRLAKNLVAMATAIEGIFLTKVHQGTGKVNKDYRKVAVCDETMRLKWCKQPYRFGKGESFVEMDKIISIGYGCMTRAHALTDANPCLCFAVNTVERSYDFICRDQDEAECFVLSISRLCNIMAGFAIPGSIPTHALFLRAAAWAKVHQKCRKEHKTLLAVIDSAVRSATDTMSPPRSPAPKALPAAPATPRNGGHTESGYEGAGSGPPGGGVGGWHGSN